MKNCEQMKDFSVYEHGLSVHNYYLALKSYILNNEELKYEWKLPEWINDSFIWDRLENNEVIKNYQIFHDCGKPYCIEFDSEGKNHFPNHSQVSSDIWRDISGNDIEADLMLHDMDIHLLRGSDIEIFCHLPYALTLLITGLCEVHSNASMFGGIDSTSFKIKWKNINKFGKRIIDTLKKKEGVMQ
jgi:hypothetical protein